MGCRREPAANNQGILLLGALASIQLAQGLDLDQIEMLAAFFTVLGDNLALLAAPPCWGNLLSDTEENAEV